MKLFRAISMACLLVGSSACLTAQEPSKPSHQDLSYFLSDQKVPTPIRCVADWMVRRQQIMRNVESVMGEFPDRSSVPIELEFGPSEIRGDVEYQKISFCSDRAEQKVGAWLLQPTKRDVRQRAAVLCLHQTFPIGKDEVVGLGGNPNLHYALELAQRGFITLSLDYPTLGEYEYDFEKDEYASGSMKAIVDNRRAMDVLIGISGVDPNAIGCIGHSLGGHNAIFTAVFDERIKAVVSCCGFTRFHKYYRGDLKGWSGPRYMPRIASEYGNDPNRVPFDFPELIAALAPRPFLAVAPLHDDNFEVSGVRDCIDAAKPIYRLFHRENLLKTDYPDAAHDFPLESRERAYRFLESSLGYSKD